LLDVVRDGQVILDSIKAAKGSIEETSGPHCVCVGERCQRRYGKVGPWRPGQY
jgi:hypothetical protein